LERLTQTFLDFARPPEPAKRAFDARDLAAPLRALLARRAAQQGVRLACAPPRPPLVLRADARPLPQVLVNLLLNALDALPGGGTVWLRLAAEGGAVLLTVADTGGGLPPALGDKIFEPFVSTKGTGIGLGLSVSKRIVEAHGGTLAAA